MSARSRMCRVLGLLSVALLALLMGACTPLATWPPTEGTQPLVPWAEPCPQLMATAVSFTRQNTDPSAPLVFDLPQNTEWKVWDQVRTRLGADARMMEPTDVAVFDVRQVRLNGGQSEVDVAYRTPEGIWQLATVHSRGSFGGHYRPTYFQRWMIPTDAAVYGTPPPPPKPVSTCDWPKSTETAAAAPSPEPAPASN